MARRKFVCGNWKMHKTAPEAVALVKELAAGIAEASGGGRVQVAVAPTFTALAPVAGALAGSGIELAAQNVHWEAQGAFTGEISAAMLADACCTHCIVGHSERRQLFGETRRELLHQGDRLGGGLVHLPVAADELPARHHPTPPGP